MQKNIIYGFHAIMEAIKAGKEIDKVLIKQGLRGDLYGDLMIILKENKVPYQYVPVEKLDRLTRMNHQGAIAFASEISFQSIEEIIPNLYEKGECPLILVLDSITDVRNLGAIARTAECAGVHAIIVPLKGMAQINADAIKTSAGALNKIPVCRVVNMKFTLRFLQESGIQIVAATEKASQLIYEPDFKKPTAIIMGAEDKGISPELLRICDIMTKIPMKGAVASLNVSVAAGIMIYEAIRQRN
jgi:23S rRNA (guanosine2251-2'-O)-methyltransferase